MRRVSYIVILVLLLSSLLVQTAYGESKAENGYKYVYASKNHSMAIKQDGTVWEWGYIERLNTYKVSPGHNTRTIRCKTVWTMNSYENVYKPEMLKGISNIKSLACGFSGMIMLDEQGSVWVKGNGIEHVAGFEKVKAIAIGGRTREDIYDERNLDDNREYYMALEEDGSLWIWGNNEDGHLGTHRGKHHCTCKGS